MNIDNDNDEGDDALVRCRVLIGSMRMSVAAEKRCGNNNALVDEAHPSLCGEGSYRHIA